MPSMAALLPTHPAVQLAPTHRSCVLCPSLHRQQGKECTDDVKVFSRAIPFDQLGRERDVRVFIARSRKAGEVVQTVAERAAALERKKQAIATQQAQLLVPAQGLIQVRDGVRCALC